MINVSNTVSVLDNRQEAIKLPSFNTLQTYVMNKIAIPLHRQFNSFFYPSDLKLTVYERLIDYERIGMSD